MYATTARKITAPTVLPTIMTMPGSKWKLTWTSSELSGTTGRGEGLHWPDSHSSSSRQSLSLLQYKAGKSISLYWQRLRKQIFPPSQESSETQPPSQFHHALHESEQQMLEELLWHSRSSKQARAENLSLKRLWRTAKIVKICKAILKNISTSNKPPETTRNQGRTKTMAVRETWH